MKRRDFVKAGICLGCAGALGTGAMLCKKEGITSLSDIEIFLRERKFLYKSEKDLPTRIRLDICNLCQLNCAACWIRKGEEVIKRDFGGFGYVPFETFKNFIDSHPFIEEIELSNAGEIFLNPELEDIVRYAYEKGITLTANSGVNLNTLSDSMAEALVKYQFKAMNVAVDGTTPEVYAMYRRGGDFNTVINNIKKINYFKEKYNSKYPILVYKVILFGHNAHQIESSKELAKKLNTPVWFAINMVKEYSPYKPEDEKKVYEAASLYMNTLDMEVTNLVDHYKRGIQNYCFCTDIYEKPQINWNGDLFGCCTPYYKTFKINVFEEGMLKAMNNEKVLYTKLMLSDFSVEPKEKSVCYGCMVYDMLKNENLPIKIPSKYLLHV